MNKKNKNLNIPFVDPHKTSYLE